MQKILGLGTGRCGTTSLARLLSVQPNSMVSHEFDKCVIQPFLRWNKDDSEVFFQFYKETIKKGHGKLFVGDVSFYLIKYVRYALKEYPDIKCVCLERDKKLVVKSFIDKTPAYSGVSVGDLNYRNLNPLSGVLPPMKDGHNKKEALERYWDIYKKVSDAYQRMLPRNFKKFSTDSLNTEEGIDSILDFVGYPKEGRVYKIFHEN